MCGISGLISNTLPKEQVINTAALMADSLKHRGPDEYGIWHDPNVNIAVSHRRLSIQDLSSNGSQPMLSPSKRYVIVYNGEIYNFKQLSVYLQKENYRFKGGSDTEVILAACEHWGIKDAINRFSGMFAFALWDRDEKTLYLCRDRMGEKPLYYGVIEGTFYFSSELKPIKSLLKNKLELNLDALTYYMRYGYFPHPHTVYKGFYKLPPGSLLSLPFNIGSENNVLENSSFPKPIKYWDILGIAKGDNNSNEIDVREATDQLDLILNETIKNQSIADVPIGAFLSGGIDSTLVTSILQSQSTNPIKTFTIGFQENTFNEAEHAKKIANYLGTDHHEIYLTANDSLDVISKLSEIYDEPFADSSQIPTYLISKLARDDVKVCLSGDGGDELFGGYNRYHLPENIYNKSEKLPKFIRKLLSKSLTNIPQYSWDRLYNFSTKLCHNKNIQSNIGNKIHKFADIIDIEDLSSIYTYLISYWNDPSALVLNGTELEDLKFSHTKLENTSFQENAMLWDQINYLPGDNLTKVDRASMAVSLEARLPLLDHNIVEFSWELPLELKFNKKPKWLLRQVLNKYIPVELIDRPKMGFSVPIASWLRDGLNDWANDLLSSNTLKSQGYLNHKVINNIMREHESGLFDHSNKLWTVLMFQAWLNPVN